MITKNIDSQLNFTGCFRIKPTELKAQKEIPELFTQGRQIFSDIFEKGDKVIVIRDNYDKRIGNYIKENQVFGIDYYPEINTKAGLDSEQPEGLKELINAKSAKVITGLENILEAITGQKKATKTKKLPKAENEMEKISNALRLNIEKPQINSSEKSTIIRDDVKNRTIEIIAPNRATSYVYVRPDFFSEDPIRCIINGKGEVVKKFETPNEILKFSKLFRKFKNENLNILK